MQETVYSFARNRRLWEWVCQTKELGTVRLLRPRLFVMLDDQSSNLERIWDDLKSTYQNTPPINNSSEKTNATVASREGVSLRKLSVENLLPKSWSWNVPDVSKEENKVLKLCNKLALISICALETKLDGEHRRSSFHLGAHCCIMHLSPATK